MFSKEANHRMSSPFVIKIENNLRPLHSLSPKLQAQQERRKLKLINGVFRKGKEMAHDAFWDLLAKETFGRSFRTEQDATYPTCARLGVASTVGEYYPSGGSCRHDAKGFSHTNAVGKPLQAKLYSRRNLNFA